MAGAGTVHAHGADVVTSDQVGAVTGNQVVAPIQAPVNICGIAAAVLGAAGAGCEGGSEAQFEGFGGDFTSEDNVGLANGNQAYAPVQVPVEVSSIAAAIGGASQAWSAGGSTASIPESGRHGGADVTTRNNTGLLSGNQLLAPIQAPIDVCGNAVALAGAAGAGCEGGSEAQFEGFGGDFTSEDNVGLANGNQVFAPIQAPINVCGNAIAIFGYASASCEGGSEANIEEPEDPGHKEVHKYPTAAEADVYEERLPLDAVPALDDVASDLTDGLPAGDLGSNVTPEDVASTVSGTVSSTVSGVTDLVGANLL